MTAQFCSEQICPGKLAQQSETTQAASLLVYLMAPDFCNRLKLHKITFKLSLPLALVWTARLQKQPPNRPHVCKLRTPASAPVCVSATGVSDSTSAPACRSYRILYYIYISVITYCTCSGGCKSWCSAVGFSAGTCIGHYVGCMSDTI